MQIICGLWRQLPAKAQTERTRIMEVGKDTDTVEIEVESGGLCQPLRRRVRRFLSAKQLYECLHPLFHVTYWHGLTSFYISSDSATGHKDIKKTILGFVNGIMHITIYTVCYSLTILNNCESVASYFFRSRITYFGDMMQIVSGFIGVTVIYLTAIIPNHRLERCLQKFHTMDVQLQTVGIKIMYSKVLRFSYMILFSMFMVNFCFACGTFSVLYSSRMAPSIALHFTFLIQHTVISIAIAVFSCITYLVEMRIMSRENRQPKTVSSSQAPHSCGESASKDWLKFRLSPVHHSLFYSLQTISSTTNLIGPKLIARKPSNTCLKRFLYNLINLISTNVDHEPAS